MNRRTVHEDEERLLDNKNAAGDVGEEEKVKLRKFIPRRAYKSIIVAVLLVALGLFCLGLLVYFAVSENITLTTEITFVLLFILILTTSSGIWQLKRAYMCYNNVEGYEWPILFD